MSWFNRTGSFRNSFRGKSSPSPPKELDANACYESFKMHWLQAWEIVSKQSSQPKGTKADAILAVLNHIDQMVTLLIHDLRIPNNTMGPILDFMLTENVLDKLFSWSINMGEYVNPLKLEQLKLYEVLISHSQQELLVHKPILQPMLKLLSTCSECAPVEVEKRLVILLNQLCVSLTQNAALLEFFFSISTEQGPARFLIFSLLIPFVHREGGIGQQARDALLLCMSLSMKNESIGQYIAENSNFCPILATGLSGLYSLLPRKLTLQVEDWHRFTTEDVHEIPELSMFLNSLEFCNAVIQVSYPLVREQMLEYLYAGFLLPVLGPALHQTSLDEIIAATAYLDLFLRTITEPSLIEAFLKFIFTESYDNNLIIDSLIARIGTQSRLCLVTLALFKSLLDLNCEDVMLFLVFRYLIPCSHIMVSQRCRVKDADFYSKTAEKFLSLIPACCQPEETLEQEDPAIINPSISMPSISSGSVMQHNRSFTMNDAQAEIQRQLGLPTEFCQSSYADYLHEAHSGVRLCMQSCKYWTHLYDGNDPSPSDNLRFALGSTLRPNQRSQSVGADKRENIVNSINENRRHSYGDCIDGETQILPQVYDSTTIPHGFITNLLEVKDTVNSSSSDLSKIASELAIKVENRNSEICCIGSLPESASTADNCAVIISNKSREMAPEFSESSRSQVAVDEDQQFLNMLRRCETPPPSSLEDSLAEIDSALCRIETYRQNAAHGEQDFPKSDCQQSSSCATENGDHAVEESDLPGALHVAGAGQPVTTETGVKFIENESKEMSHIYSSVETIGNPIYTRTLSSQVSLDQSGASPDIGPFLGMLLTKLENMMQNTLYTNLQLTGVIARLAYYPQPLLRSFLLNHTLVFQPTVRSLLQVLGSLKHKLDGYSNTVDNFSNLLVRARKFLLAREERLMCDNNGSVRFPVDRSRRNSSPEGHKVEQKRRSLTEILFRRTPLHGDKDKQHAPNVILEGIPDGTGYRYINRPFPGAAEGKLESLKTKNAVLCAVVLEEFLKELAAITQEHSVVELDEWEFDVL